MRFEDNFEQILAGLSPDETGDLLSAMLPGKPDAAEKAAAEAKAAAEKAEAERKAAVEAAKLAAEKAAAVSAKNEPEIHKAIKKVADDIENLKMNTAIAALMAMVNEFYSKGLTKGDLKTLMDWAVATKQTAVQILPINDTTITGTHYLRITDRKKDIFKLSAGKYIAPQLLENKLRESEYIDQAMVVGENEKSAAVIISPNFNTLHYWALKYHLHYRDNSELIALPETKEKFKQVIDDINRNFSAHEQIKAFRIVTDEWTSANGLLSPTLKIKRNLLMAKYKALIADIYGKEASTSNPLFSAFRSVDLPSFGFGKCK